VGNPAFFAGFRSKNISDLPEAKLNKEPIMIHPWPVVHSTKKSYRIFNLRTDRAVSPRTKQAHDFFILESAPWVNIIPITAHEEVVFIRQYRHGIQDTTLEVPGGLVESFDDPRSAAVRELKEETGYEGRDIRFLGKVHPNPAIQDNECHSFAIWDVVQTDRQDLDAKEDIETVLYPLSVVPQLINSGEISHSLVLCAFFYFFAAFRPDLLPIQTEKGCK
jgi:8-oxo-dGTP pyrophosphatase MutT (NUDIX family)